MSHWSISSNNILLRVVCSFTNSHCFWSIFWFTKKNRLIRVIRLWIKLHWSSCMFWFPKRTAHKSNLFVNRTTVRAGLFRAPREDNSIERRFLYSNVLNLDCKPQKIFRVCVKWYQDNGHLTVKLFLSLTSLNWRENVYQGQRSVVPMSPTKIIVHFP